MASTSTGACKSLFQPPSDSEDEQQTTSTSKQQLQTPTSPRRRAGKGRESLAGSQAAGTGAAFGSANNSGNFYVDSSDEDDDEDDDDPVIKTLPVFLTPALANSMALLQYPHRPPAPHTSHPLLPPSLRPASGEDDLRPRSQRISARYKPSVGQLELSVPLDVRQGIEEHRFNQERAGELGRGITKGDLGAMGSGTAVTASTSASAGSAYGNGSSYNDSRNFDPGNKGQLQRMTLLGETLPDQTWYTCVVLKDDEVHLTPLTRTMQMRASLSYLDELDALERSNAKKERAARAGEASDDERGSGGEGDSDYEDGGANKSASALAARKQKKLAAADKKAKQDDLKTINVSVSASEPAGGAGAGGSNGQGGPRDAKTARAAASLFGPIKAAQDETWVDLPFYDPLSEDANRVYEKLFASKTDKLHMLTSATQYLRF